MCACVITFCWLGCSAQTPYLTLSLSLLGHADIGVVGRMSTGEVENDGPGAARGEGREDGGGARVPASTTGPAVGTRPLVLPEIFDGTTGWSEWHFHFENVAAVNGWGDAEKLRWLRVRTTGRAQKALLRLPTAVVNSYEATRDALRTRFEPESRQTRYQAEFQLRRKKAAESWADFGDDLRNLADKAYPDLQEEARERLSINAYLGQLPQPQLSFAVRQKQPATVDEAVAATLELESYLFPHGAASVGQAEVDSVDRAGPVAKLTDVVGRLVDRVEQLQLQVVGAGQPLQAQQLRQPTRRPRRGFVGECWNCRQPGHMARNCPVLPPQEQNQSQKQGN